MLQVHDIRETRVYQEAHEEGLKEGIEKGIAIAIRDLAAGKMSAKKIATLLKVDVKQVRQVLAEGE